MRIPLRYRQGSSLKSLEALELNFALSMVKGIKPRDDTEAMLATQMAAIHKKRTRQPCRAPAVRRWTVCRCHGARGGAPTGKGNGRYRHGGRTKSAIAERRAVSKLVREVRASIARLV
jgi:hypothetical protein